MNSLLLGASEVTIFDINERVKEFYELKRNLILETTKERIMDKVINSKQFLFFGDFFMRKQLEAMNLYLQSDENYNKLRNILERKTINFITGNIFDIDNFLISDGKYDRVILSNVLDYIPSNLFSEEVVYKVYNDLIKYLNDDGIIQLYYLYGSMYPKDFIKVMNKFEQNNIFFELSQCDENFL